MDERLERLEQSLSDAIEEQKRMKRHFAWVFCLLGALSAITIKQLLL